MGDMGFEEKNPKLVTNTGLWLGSQESKWATGATGSLSVTGEIVGAGYG